MTDYTPTTDEVREQFAANTNRFGDDLGTREVGREGFDRWLAAHDRKIAAEALREAANDLAAMVDDDLTVIVGDPDDDETWVPVRLEDWLTTRADRIEQGGES